MPVSLAYERLGTNRLRAVQIAVVLLLLIVIWSAVKRFVIDIPNLAAGTLPEHEFDHRYVQQRWLAYLVSYRFRSRHYTFHRRQVGAHESPDSASSPRPAAAAEAVG
jgi:hypothetical protein